MSSLSPGWDDLLIDTNQGSSLATPKEADRVSSAADNVSEELVDAIQVVGRLLWGAFQEGDTAPGSEEVYRAGFAIESLAELLKGVMFIQNNANFAQLNFARGLDATGRPTAQEAA